MPLKTAHLVKFTIEVSLALTSKQKKLTDLHSDVKSIRIALIF